VSFRTRLFLAILFAVLLPLAALALGVRREMEGRLTTEYYERVSSTASAIEADLVRESAAVARRLRALVSDLTGDNRFRLAVVRNDGSSRGYLLNYAEGAMQLAGLALLQLQDSSGRIISSGHFRNQFDRIQPELPGILARLGDSLALVRARTPDTALLALARVDSLRIAGKRFTVIGGIEAERWLRTSRTPDQDLSVSISYPGAESEPAASWRVIRTLALPYVNLLDPSGVRLDTAELRVTQSLATLETLRQSVDRWILLALALTLAAAILCAAWLSSRISRPLRQLSRKTAAIDLDRLDQQFDTGRTDEIGGLSRLLDAMTGRLRASSARLREVERRAAVGDVARQVNHDIKNGLAPIRNVLRHLTQVAEESPGSLPEIFAARRGTLESSVEYLDTLARNYDRLAPDVGRRPCEVNAIVAEVLRSTTVHDGARLHARLDERLPNALGDGLMIRRALENLVGNAADSLGERPEGSVTVTTELIRDGTDRIRIIVADTGRGMTQEELERAFDDFYTTKPGGTGLGLSIARRLILDLDGTLRVETEPGVGTRMILELPAAVGGDAG
jgi:signal transduction histidine kinase